MKTVRIQIARYNFDKYVEYDNLVSREEVIHAVLAKGTQGAEFRADRGDERRDQEAWDRAVYITWFEGDAETAREAVEAAKAEALEVAVPDTETAPEEPAPTPDSDEEDAG